MATHTDGMADETDHATQDRVSEFQSLNAEVVGDITARDLYQSVEEINLQKPIILALAKTNKRDEFTDSPADDTDTIFDEAVCDVAHRCFELAGLEDQPIPSHHLPALLLQEVRDISGYGDLADYIDDYASAQLAQFGLQRTYDQSTYRKARNKLDDEGPADVVAEAAVIAANALFANGVPVPATVQNRYNLSYEVDPDASAFPVEARDLALYTMTAELLDIVVEHLDFNRDPNKSRDLRSVVGAFARAATDERSIEEYHHRARHQFGLDTALKGSTIRSHIGKLDHPEVKEMFDDIHQALLGYVIDSEGLSAPTMSYDITKIQGGTEPDSHPYRREDGKWEIASLGITDPDLEFAVGHRILKSNSSRHSELKNLLRNLAAHTDVGLLMTDRGFDGAADIVACRTFAEDDWLIFGQDYSDTDQGNDDFERLREKLEPGKTAVVEGAGYSNLNPPVKLIGYSGASEDDDSIEPFRAFYTNIEVKPADERGQTDTDEAAETIQELNFTYNQRSKIETMFRLSKNDFDVATDSKRTAQKAFYYNMSLVFYNVYKIVNTVPAPNNGLEITTSQKELLAVMENLAFGGPRQPAAQTYLQDQS